MKPYAAAIGQSSFDALWWLCLAIVIGLSIAAVWFVYWLGKLPGETAYTRGHPQASSITVCGWLGLLFLPLWPIAMVWAYLIPPGKELAPPPDLKGVQSSLEETSARIAQIERQLGKTGGEP